MMKKNKRGSHVGVMISFAIFITFVVFLFVIFEPIVNQKKERESELTFLEEELIELFNSDLAIIQQTADRYNSGDEGYDELKTELNVPDNIEFAFSFVDEEQSVNIIAEKEIPKGINVYTKQTLILYGEGNDKAGYLTIKIW